MRTLLRCGIALSMYFAISLPAYGQGPITGTPPFGSFSSGIDTVNLGNLNVHIAIPIVRKAGRGIPFDFAMHYDSSTWGVFDLGYTGWGSRFGSGWWGSEAHTGFLTWTDDPYATCGGGGTFYYSYNYVYTDANGTPHPFDSAAQSRLSNCTAPDPVTEGFSAPELATDSSGYTLMITVEQQGGFDVLKYEITTPSGSKIYPPASTSFGPFTVVDSNGNKITNEIVSGKPTYTDTLGTQVLEVSGYPGDVVDLEYQTTTGTAVTKLHYSWRTVESNFQCSGVSDQHFGLGATRHLTQIELADGTTYDIAYELTPDPTTAGNITGRIASLTLPTGGAIEYSYDDGDNNINCDDGSINKLTRTTPDGTWIYTRSKSGSTWTTIVRDPSGKETEIEFQEASNSFYEQTRSVFDGTAGGTLLSKTDTCYTDTAPCDEAVEFPITITRSYTYLNGSSLNQLSKTVYNTYGLIEEQSVYDWTTSSPGTLLRKTETTYNDSLSNGIVDRPEEVTVSDSVGIVAKTSYLYDETSVAGTSAPMHDSVSGSRGNPTTIARWVNTTNSYLNTVVTYDDTGNVLTTTDPGGHATTYTYSSGSAYGFATQTQHPTTGAVQHIEYATYDTDTGLLTDSTEENGNKTCFQYDDMLRITHAKVPNSGSCSGTDHTTWSYSTSAPFVVTQTQAAAPSSSMTTITTADSLGRPIKTQQSDPSGDTYVVNQYDAVGRLACVTNPHRAPAVTDCSSSSEKTLYAYDGLGRGTVVTQPGGDTISTSYSSESTAVCTTVEDEAGKLRKSCINAFGQLAYVVEPDATSGTLSYETHYVNDALGNLRCAEQRGATGGTGCSTSPSSDGTSAWRVRRFTYDSLSRLRESKDPESGLTQYDYDADGTLQAKTSPAPERTVQITPIPVANEGFEADSLSDGSYTYSLSGWIHVDGGATGTFNPSTSAFDSIPNGSNTAFLGHTTSAIEQVTDETITAGATYRLMFHLGRQKSEGVVNVTAGFYYADTLLADQAFAGPDANSFSSHILEYTVPSTGAMIGQALKIRLSRVSSTGLPNLDQVSLEKIAPFAEEQTANISVTNNGAEADSLADGAWTSNSMTGWTTVTNPNSWGAFNPTTSHFDSIPEGSNIVFISGYSSFEQTTGENIGASATYRLVFKVGRRKDQGSGSVKAAFYYGSTLLTEQTFVSPAPNTFANATLQYTAPASGAMIGQPLKIRFTGGGGGQINFDSIALQEVTTSEPETVTTTYCYDALHRLVGKAYAQTTCPLSSPAATYTYDQGTNGKGHRTAMADGSGSSSWTYDVFGRVTGESRTISGITKSTSYGYNQTGALTSVTYPSGRVISYDISSAGQATFAKDTANSINYLTDATYNPAGQLAGAKNGMVGGGFAGIITANTYNSRLQPDVLKAYVTTSNPPDVLGLDYDYGLGSGDNGNVLEIENLRDSNRTQNFQYDKLNRIKQAHTSGSAWGETFTIDPWGNLTNRDGVSGKTNYEPLDQAPAAGTNRLSSFTYDAAGNLTSDGVNSYTYDPDSRLTQVGSWSYVYDGVGQRVKKSSGSNGTLYWRGLGGQVLAESNLSGTLQYEYIFFNGARVARRDVASGDVHYFFSDHLGSQSVITNATGTIVEESDYYPYGGEIVVSNGLNPQPYKFTGMERDSESGLDHTWFRKHSPALGRWMTPDPAGLAAANPTNPQSWNKYGYVGNNPSNMTDPSGLCFGVDDWFSGPQPGWGGGGCSFTIPLPGPCSFRDCGNDGLTGLGIPSSPPVAFPTSRGTVGYGGESLGIPNGLGLPQHTIWDIFLPEIQQCDFGPCIFGLTDAEKAQIFSEVYRRAAPISNPCFWGEYAFFATLFGGAGVAGANAEAIGTAAVENYPIWLTKAFEWMARSGSRQGAPGALGAVIQHIQDFGRRVNSGCGQLQ